MPIKIDDVMEKAFEKAFSHALEHVLHSKAEQLFKVAFTNDSPLSRKLEAKIEAGFQHFLEEGIKWEKGKAGFRK